MISQIRSKALFTAIKTPYLENGKIDLESYSELVEYQIRHGVEGIIVGGTTGEGHLMSWDEHIMLIAYSVRKYADQLIIVGNTGSNNTGEAVTATEQGFAVGMHASLQVNPYYGKTSEAGLIHHFNRVLDFGPAMIYNVPSRTSQDLLPNLIEKIASHDNFLGVKECAGSDRIAHYSQKGIVCWSGNDDQCFQSRHQCGSHGVVSVASNLLPGAFRTLMDNENSDLPAKMADFLRLLYAEPNPIGLNSILPLFGLGKPVFRSPYLPVNKNQRKELLDTLSDVNFPELKDLKRRELEDGDFSVI